MSSISSFLSSATARAQSYTASAGSSSNPAEQVVGQTAEQTQVSLALSMVRAEHDASQQMVDIMV